MHHNNSGFLGNEYGINGNMYNSLSMMVMMPLITSMCTKLVDFVIALLRIIGEIILIITSKFTNKYDIKNDYTVEIELFTIFEVVVKTTRYGKAILWYFEKNSINLSKNYLFCFDDFVKNENNQQNSLMNFGIEQKTLNNCNDIQNKNIVDQMFLLLPIPSNLEKTITDTITKPQDNPGDLKNTQTENVKFKYLENDIYVGIIKNKRIETYDRYYKKDVVSVSMVLKSNKGLQHINNYIINIGKEYTKYEESIMDKYYGRMFLMNSSSSDKQNTNGIGMIGYNNNNVPSIEYTEYKYDKTQTFDNLFFDKKNDILSQLDNLKNAEYFQTRGLKRKLSLLIYGPTGSGKTCCVNAIANYTKRAIVCIPISRIKTSVDIEKILYCNNYNNNIIENKDKIILFDEIDAFSNIRMEKKKRAKQLSKKKQRANVDECKNKMNDDKSNNDDKDNNDDEDDNDRTQDPFNVGVFLSLLDGVNDQDNMIIVATANNIESIEPSLYRNGRLKLTNMTYIGRNEIKEMIEMYHMVKLNEEQTNLIRNDKKIQNLTIKCLCIEYASKSLLKYNNVINELITKINELHE
jgi:hypothetical protein